MKNSGSIIGGILLIVFGVIIGGNALDFWHIDLFFPGWWTLFIIVPSLFNIKKQGFNMGNTICLILGIFLFVSAWDFIPWGLFWKLLVPGFCILLGLFVLFGRNRKNQDNDYTYQTSDTAAGDIENVSAVLGSAHQRVVNEIYNGGKVRAILGGSVLDLSCATIQGDIHIDVDVVLGSAEIYLPPYVKVAVDSSPFLGGVENRAGQTMAVNAPTVHLSCSAILGGIEIK